MSSITLIDELQITPIKYIGKGEFGEVYKGIYREKEGSIIFVAVKVRIFYKYYYSLNFL